jgi:hypothetical protein
LWRSRNVRLLRTRLQLRELLTQAFGDPERRLVREHHHDGRHGFQDPEKRQGWRTECPSWISDVPALKGKLPVTF